jgi:NAD(P)H-nitrite reductase large subunit
VKAGTSCGSCIPELKRLIGQAGAGGTADEKPKLTGVAS